MTRGTDNGQGLGRLAGKEVGFILRRDAPAKLNLALSVGPPRPQDGLHPICSWFVPIRLCDEIEVERLPEDRRNEISIGWADDAMRADPIDWPLDQDLAARAHRLLEKEVGRRLPAAIRVRKRIPAGAGLAGGSTDGAAALLALRDLFELPIDDDRLRALGLRLGADVPFFLPPEPAHAAIVEGVGERIERAPAPAARALLVAPPFGCSTAAVYREFDARPGPALRPDHIRHLAAAPAIPWEELFNDLAEPACRVEPRLTRVQESIADALSREAHITGSGSGVFAPIHEEEDGETSLRGALEACERVGERVSGRIVEIGSPA